MGMKCGVTIGALRFGASHPITQWIRRMGFHFWGRFRMVPTIWEHLDRRVSIWEHYWAESSRSIAVWSLQCLSELRCTYRVGYVNWVCLYMSSGRQPKATWARKTTAIQCQRTTIDRLGFCQSQLNKAGMITFLLAFWVPITDTYT